MDLLLLRLHSAGPPVDADVDGHGDGHRHPHGLVRALRAIGARTVRDRPVRADPAEVDGALSELGPDRLVVSADRAGLNLVLHRLLRAGLLEGTDTAVLPTEDIGYLTRVGLPASGPERVRTAVHAPTRLVGVVRDDSGGVCLDAASVAPFSSGKGDWWVRAVVDDQPLRDGTARAISMTRVGPDELAATVTLGRFRRRTVRGRSLQLACDEALIVQDGIPRERPRSRRTLWSEPALWRLAV
jgi:hypothetical protein